MQLLNMWIRKDVSKIQDVLDILSNERVPQEPKCLGPFKIRDASLSKNSIREYILVLLTNLKRLNKPVHMDIVPPVSSSVDKAIMYLDIGCPELAMQMEESKDGSFPPNLMWDIHNSIL